MKDVSQILIYGAGMMGKGIAMVLCANPTYRITLFDVVDGDVFPPIRQNFRQLTEKSILTQDEVDARLSRIRFTTDRTDAAISGADMVIECVFENMQIKQDAFAFLESVCRPDCIFCTNTSVMSPTEIAANLTHKERFVGTHFWNPAHLIPLVEVVRTEQTDPAVADLVVRVLCAAGKKAVLCKKDVPGFIANRMQHALWREAVSLVENGIADPETVDLAVQNSFGLRLPYLPPLENADMVGLDLTKSIHDYLLPHLEDSHSTSPVINGKVAAGELGYKTGKGLFDRSPEQIAQKKAGLNEYLIRMLYGK